MHSKLLRRGLRPLLALLGPVAAAPALRGQAPPAADSGRPAPLAVYRGHYKRAFEDSRFVPCPDPHLPPALLAALRGAPHSLDALVWVPSWGNDRRNPTPYPAVPRRPGYPLEWFVEYRGAFSAPGQYGHMNVGRYEFRIDSVLSARAPTGDDCAGPPPGAP